MRIGGALRESFDEHLNRVELRRLSYLGKMALVLGRRLWSAAGSPEVDTNRLLVSIGTALANTEEIAEGAVDWQARGLKAMSPLAVQMYMPNAPGRDGRTGTPGQGGCHRPPDHGRRLRCGRHCAGLAAHCSG